MDKYTLVDGEEMYRLHPDTFWMPAKAERDGLHIGDLVKLIFVVQGYVPERMWVEISGRGEAANGEIEYTGTLENVPERVHTGGALEQTYPLTHGDTVVFSPKHIINCMTRQEMEKLKMQVKSTWSN